MAATADWLATYWLTMAACCSLVSMTGVVVVVSSGAVSAPVVLGVISVEVVAAGVVDTFAKFVRTESGSEVATMYCPYPRPSEDRHL